MSHIMLFGLTTLGLALAGLAAGAGACEMPHARRMSSEMSMTERDGESSRASGADGAGAVPATGATGGAVREQARVNEARARARIDFTVTS